MPAPTLVLAFPEAGRLLDAMRAAGLTLAAAESCTGGLFTAALTAFAGSSEVVRGALVTYADDLKSDLLGVREGTLAAHGAVSAEVAREMAERVRSRCAADVGVGITGVAGPGGGSAEKPAGLIYVAADSGERTELRRLEDDRGREANRAAAVRAALELCLRLV